MDSQPLISVCIPTYNRPKEIQEAVSSITVQLDDELKDLVEIVVSHDPGAANAQEVQDIIEGLANKWDNVRYFRNEKNMRFSNGSIANAHANWKYIVMLSDDDCLTNFSLSYLVEIIEKTWFDFLLSKPLFTPDIDVSVEKTPNTYSIYHGIKEFIEWLYAKEKWYQYLVSYFSFNSIMVVKASYRNESYLRVDKEVVLKNEFPQEFPPYFDLKEKIIIFAESTLVKGRIANASYYGSVKLIEDFKVTMEYIEKQNNLAWLPSRKAVKKICISGWTRTMYLWIILSKFQLDYKKKWLVRWLYFIYKKYIQ